MSSTSSNNYSVICGDSKVLPILDAHNCKTVVELLGHTLASQYLDMSDIPLGQIPVVLQEYRMVTNLLKAVMHDLHIPYDWPLVC